MPMPLAERPLLISAEWKPVLTLFLKNLWIFFVLGAAGFAIGKLRTHRQLDIYSASAEILLSPDDGLDYQKRLLQDLGARKGTEDVQNQLRIIQSFDLVGRAVDRLNAPIDFFFVGRIRTTQVDGFSNLEIEALPELFASEMLGRDLDLVVRDAATYELSYTAPNGQTVALVQPFGIPIEGPDVALTVRFTKGSGDVERAKKQNFRIRVYNRSGRIAQFRQGLSVENVERTSILSLRATSTLPGRSKQFLDTLAYAYIEFTKDAKLESSMRTEEFIDRQLNELVSILDSVERQVDRFKADNRVLDLSREQTDFFNALVEREAELRKVELRLTGLDAIHNQLTASAGDVGLPPTALLAEQDPLLVQQVNRLFELRNQRTAALIDVTEDSYAVRRIDSALRSARFTIARYIEDSRNVLSQRRTALAREVAGIESRLGGLPTTQRDVLSLERKLKVNEDLYEFLLQAKATAVINRAGIAPAASLIEQARFGGRIGPDKNRTILLTTGVGLLVALGIALVRFAFFERIDRVDVLRDLTPLPIAGGIPHYPEIEIQPISFLHDGRSQVTESFRSIRTSINYTLPAEGCSILLVSSLHAGEGKSFVSTNIAAMLAKAGKRVALVDVDLHKPKIHRNLRLANRLGLSTLLSGHDSAETIRQTGPVDNLDVYVAGPVPPNASELILHPRFKSFLADLERTYDYIVLDSPPIVLISDAMVLLPQAHRALLVMNAQRTTRASIHHIERILSEVDGARVSLIINDIRFGRWEQLWNRYAAKYGYGYGYGTGYGGYGGYGSGPLKNSLSGRYDENQG